MTRLVFWDVDTLHARRRPRADRFLVTDAMSPARSAQSIRRRAQRLLKSWRDRGVHFTLWSDLPGGSRGGIVLRRGV